MSQSTSSYTLKSSTTILPTGGLTVLANSLIGVGIVILVLLCGLGVSPWVDHSESGYAWLFSFLFFFTLAIGSLFWSVVHHAVHAAWTTLFRRLWENVAASLPILAAIFAMIILSGPNVYRWMQPEVLATDSSLQEKAGYLSNWFFFCRAFLFFLLFISTALYYRRLSVSQDRDGSLVPSAIMQRKSYVLLALCGLGLTFASFDWIMSLDYHWASTMFGVTIFAGAATASAALIILLTLGFQKAGYLEMVNTEHYHLLGKVLFAFVTFWGWVSFAQYLFIWYANIPEETLFFINRSRGSWALMAYAMIFFKFMVPFLILLLQATKRSPFWLALCSISVLFGHAIELYWIVMPNLHPEGFTLPWIQIVTWLGMAMLFSGAFLHRCLADAIYPIKDPRLEEAIHSHN